MLFNSYEFIFLFLPLTLLVFWRIGARGHHHVAIAWLVAASLFFYAWWNPAYLGLIVGSMLFNYALGIVLGQRRQPVILGVGIAANLALLGYFKYANFFVDTFNAVTDSQWQLEHIVLPLAISFFTFQQIAYLVDAHRGETREYNFLHYCLFVTFFPQLIAGPIVHHRQMLPQFARDTTYRFDERNVAVGLTIFTIGLCKKLLIADNISRYANKAFDAVSNGVPLTFFEAWHGTLTYTFQLYFDFSGYSDMAIGLAIMFGITIPLNFASPYKATSIIDFWKCWHMTLSQFLRDYVYIPLGGNRKGPARRYINLMLTMVLGGLWHGAAWTFVAWGAIHGLLLSLNHAWRSIRAAIGLGGGGRIAQWGGRALTFLCVAVAWVFFRAADFDSALLMLDGLSGRNGVLWPATSAQLGSATQVLSGWGWRLEDSNYFKGARDLAILGLLLAVVWLAPNTQEFLGEHHPCNTTPTSHRLRWQPNRGWAAVFGLLLLFACLQLSAVSEFLYFRF